MNNDSEILQEINSGDAIKTIKKCLPHLISHLMKFKALRKDRSTDWVGTVFNQSSILSAYANNTIWAEISKYESEIYTSTILEYYNDNKFRFDSPYDIEIVSVYRIIRNEFRSLKSFSDPELLKKYMIEFLGRENPVEEDWIKYITSYKCKTKRKK